MEEERKNERKKERKKKKTKKGRKGGEEKDKKTKQKKVPTIKDSRSKVQTMFLIDKESYTILFCKVCVRGFFHNECSEVRHCEE